MKHLVLHVECGRSSSWTVFTHTQYPSSEARPGADHLQDLQFTRTVRNTVAHILVEKLFAVFAHSCDSFLTISATLTASMIRIQGRIFPRIYKKSGIGASGKMDKMVKTVINK